MSNETDLFQKISRITKVSNTSVLAVISLHREVVTIPFIARYRREKTGNIDEVAIDTVIATYNREVFDKQQL